MTGIELNLLSLRIVVMLSSIVWFGSSGGPFQQASHTKLPAQARWNAGITVPHFFKYHNNKSEFDLKISWLM